MAYWSSASARDRFFSKQKRALAGTRLSTCCQPAGSYVLIEISFESHKAASRIGPNIDKTLTSGAAKGYKVLTGMSIKKVEVRRWRDL